MLRFLCSVVFITFIFMIVSCYHKEGRLKNAGSQYESYTLGSGNIKRDTTHLSTDSVIPLATIVEEWQMKDNTIKEKKIEIYVYLLTQIPPVKNKQLNVEIVNFTQDTIYCIGNKFLFYENRNQSWTPLRYPDNYSQPDIDYPVFSGKSIQHSFYFPFESSYQKGKYRLRLTFCNASRQVYYYVYKEFLIK